MSSQYKLSRFIVFDDKPIETAHETPQRLIFGTRQARAFLVSEPTWADLSAGRLDLVSSATHEQLRLAEIIVPAEDDELKTVIAKNQAEISANDELYQVIQPTASCQMGCGYCGQEHSSRLLGEPDQAFFLDRIRQKLAGGRYRRLRVGWFGAEPLSGLRVLRSMSPQLIRAAEAFDCRYSSKIVTNGLALSEAVARELQREHRVSEIEITLDGLADVHDGRRMLKVGGGTFDRILGNLTTLASLPDFDAVVTVRCNVDRSNVHGVSPLLRHLADRGLARRISFYVAPVHSWGNDAHLAALSHEEFAAREAEWLGEMTSLGFDVPLLPALRPIVCMAVQPDAELIDAYGDIFSCTEVSYVPSYGTQYVLGSAGTPVDSAKWRQLGTFNDDVLSGSVPCAECPMLPVCGGRCPKQWKEGVAPCPSAKFNMPQRLRLFLAASAGVSPAPEPSHSS